MERGRILIVDDAAANIRVLGESLRSEHEIIVATNGPDTLRLASSRPPPDLILLDIMMPEMDGYEVCLQLKASPDTVDIPVIFITAMNGVEDETRGLELGAVDYIRKPFNTAIVQARVRTHLELKRHRDMLAHLAQLDGLTGIANRRRFDEILDTEWRRATREPSELSLIMIDIDHFKQFNDHYGHLAGDDCIKQVASCMSRTATRAGDFVARYGGEEFACILPGTPSEAVVALAEKLRSNIGALMIPHAASSVADHVTVSQGVATLLCTNEGTPSDLVQHADQALYRAKDAGRDQIRGWPR